MSTDVASDLPSKSRLRWLCRRGMKELDVLLERFFETEFDALTADEQGVFYQLLQYEDPELNAYMLGRLQAADPAQQAMIVRIRDYRAYRPA